MHFPATLNDYLGNSTFQWIGQASKGLDRVYTGMCRNLSFDSFATRLTSHQRPSVSTPKYRMSHPSQPSRNRS